MTYILVLVLAAVASIWYFKNHKSNLFKKSLEKVDPDNNPYSELRQTAFSVTPEFLEIQLPKDSTKIYGLIMDWDVGEGIATLVAFRSGEASLYLSSGGGVIGGFNHEEIKKLAEGLIAESENHLRKANKIETTPLPEKNEIIFYFLTNHGKYAGREKMENLESNTSEWTDLFNVANQLISAIQLKANEK